MSNDTYAEYRRNLYTSAMGLVKNGDGSNVYADRIPLADVRKRFDSETVAVYSTAYVVPGDADGVNPDGTVHYSADETVIDSVRSHVVRLSDGRTHGVFGAESAGTRRQYSYLADLASGVTGEGPGDLRITAAGTTRNGGRAYLQISTGDVVGWEDFGISPFCTFGMSHDGTLSVVATFGTQIIQCANMVQGIHAKASSRVKQSARATDASIITRTRIALGIEELAEAKRAEFAAMRETQFTDAMWSTLLDMAYPVDVPDASKNIETRNNNARELLTGMYRSDARCAPVTGTLLGAWQTLNTFDNWERGTRGGTDPQTRMTDEFLSGKLGKSETARNDLLTRVLATV